MQIEPTKDLNTLVAILNLSAKQALESSEQNRRTVDEISRKVFLQEERMSRLAEENKELRQDLKDHAIKLEGKISDLEKNLLADQKKRTNMIIGSQASILLLLAAGFISYIFLFLPRH